MMKCLYKIFRILIGQWIGILVLMLISSAVPLQADMNKTGTQWSPYLEWEVENASWSNNPFDLVATVTFSHSGSSEIRTTEMFYDTLNTWKFRFTGTRTGTWTFTSSSADQDLDGLSGTVTINPNADPEEHGFVRSFDNKWGWSGTNRAFVPQFVMYDFPPFYYNDTTKINNDIETFMENHGFNGFHARVYCRWFNLNIDRSDQLPDSVNPDRRTFEALEDLITRTYNAGGLVHFWSWGDGVQTPIKWGINGNVDRRLQRYIAARLGPIPGWTMGYGYDLDEWVTESELHAWRDYMQAHLGWFHFLGGRPDGPNTPPEDHSPYHSWNAGVDYSSYEHHKPSYEVYREALDEITTQPVFSEDRFRRRNGSYPEKNYSEDETRRGLYISTMAGGVANIWGNFLDENGNAIDPPPPGGGSAPYPSPQYIKTNAEFFKDRFFKDMVPDTSITDGYALKRPTRAHYLFYREDASSIQMDLSGMECPKPAIAVDTKQAYAEIDLDTLSNVDQTWTAPYQSDWAVAVGYYGPVCSLQCRLYLGGAYNSIEHQMTTYLSTNMYIPLTAPYSANPRDIESISMDIVDWLLISIRSTADGDNILSRSVLLRKDGYLVDDTGLENKVVIDLSPGNYYLLVEHRNHLGVMSSSALAFSESNATPYSFISDSLMYYGEEACTLEPDVYGLFAGDPNQTNVINSGDYLIVKSNSGSNGYHNSDCNLTSVVNSGDYLVIKPNSGKNSNIP